MDRYLLVGGLLVGLEVLFALGCTNQLGGSRKAEDSAKDPVCCLTASADNHMLASCDGTARVRIWDAQSHHWLFELFAPETVQLVFFSQDGKTLWALQYETRSLMRWEIGKRVQLPPLTLPGGPHPGLVRSVAWIPGKQEIVFGQEYGVGWANLESGQLLDLLPAPNRTRGYSVAVAPNDGTVLAGALDGTISIWDLAKRKLTCSFRHSGGTGPMDGVRCLFLDQKGRTFLTGGFAATVKRWTLKGGLVSTYTPSPGNPADTYGHTDEPAPFEIQAVSLSPDGRLVAAASPSHTAIGGRKWGEIKLWDAVSTRELATMRTRQGLDPCIAFTPDSKWLISGEEDGLVRWHRISDILGSSTE